MFRYHRRKCVDISFIVFWLLLLSIVSSVICKPSLFGFHTSATTTNGRPPPQANNPYSKQQEYQQQGGQSDHLSEESILVWEEDEIIEEADAFLPDNPFPPNNKNQRIGIWFGPLEDDYMVAAATRAKSKNSRHHLLATTTTTTHKLRMEQWNFTVRWREDKQSRPSQMRLEFHENGFVRYQYQQKQQSTNLNNASNACHQPSDSDKDELSGNIIGTWRLAPSGVIWHLKMDGKSYSFYADVHLNPFGKRPKMFRGLVVRDRLNNNNNNDWTKHLLRPIAATFSGVGDGVDTADFSYKDRGSGLYQSSPSQAPLDPE